MTSGEVPVAVPPGPTATTMVDALVDGVADVPHLVLRSVAGAAADSAVERYEARYELERYVRKLGVSATVLRPTVPVQSVAARTPRSSPA